MAHKPEHTCPKCGNPANGVRCRDHRETAAFYEGKRLAKLVPPEDPEE